MQRASGTERRANVVAKAAEPMDEWNVFLNDLCLLAAIAVLLSLVLWAPQIGAAIGLAH